MPFLVAHSRGLIGWQSRRLRAAKGAITTRGEMSLSRITCCVTGRVPADGRGPEHKCRPLRDEDEIGAVMRLAVAHASGRIPTLTWPCPSHRLRRRVLALSSVCGSRVYILLGGRAARHAPCPPLSSPRGRKPIPPPKRPPIDLAPHPSSRQSPLHFAILCAHSHSLHILLQLQVISVCTWFPPYRPVRKILRYPTPTGSGRRKAIPYPMLLPPHLPRLVRLNERL